MNVYRWKGGKKCISSFNCMIHIETSVMGISLNYNQQDSHFQKEKKIGTHTQKKTLKENSGVHLPATKRFISWEH